MYYGWNGDQASVFSEVALNYMDLGSIPTRWLKGNTRIHCKIKIDMEEDNLPTVDQAMACVRVYQMLSNYYRAVYFFRYDRVSKIVYVGGKWSSMQKLTLSPESLLCICFRFTTFTDAFLYLLNSFTE